MTGTTRNVAKDNARVGVQAGQVYGGIHVSSERTAPTDPTKAIAGLAARLQQARTAGQLDEDTYQAAQAELAAASETLLTTTPRDMGAVTLALKKVRGLVAEVAILAAEVGTIIALVQGLS